MEAWSVETGWRTCPRPRGQRPRPGICTQVRDLRFPELAPCDQDWCLLTTAHSGGYHTGPAQPGLPTASLWNRPSVLRAAFSHSLLLSALGGRAVLAFHSQMCVGTLLSSGALCWGPAWGLDPGAPSGSPHRCDLSPGLQLPPVGARPALAPPPPSRSLCGLHVCPRLSGFAPARLPLMAQDVFVF